MCGLFLYSYLCMWTSRAYTSICLYMKLSFLCNADNFVIGSYLYNKIIYNRSIMAFLYRPLSKYIHWVDKILY